MGDVTGKGHRKSPEHRGWQVSSREQCEGGSSLGDSSATWRGIGKCPIRRPGICSLTPPFDSGTGYRMDADLIMRMLNSSRSPSSLREHKRRTKGRGASIKKVQK